MLRLSLCILVLLAGCAPTADPCAGGCMTDLAEWHAPACVGGCISTLVEWEKGYGPAR